MNIHQESVSSYPSKRIAPLKRIDGSVSGTDVGNAVVLRTAPDRLACRFLPVVDLRRYDTVVSVHRTVQIALRGYSPNRSVPHVLCREHGENEALLRRRLVPS